MRIQFLRTIRYLALFAAVGLAGCFGKSFDLNAGDVGGVERAADSVTNSLDHGGLVGSDGIQAAGGSGGTALPDAIDAPTENGGSVSVSSSGGNRIGGTDAPVGAGGVGGNSATASGGQTAGSGGAMPTGGAAGSVSGSGGAASGGRTAGSGGAMPTGGAAGSVSGSGGAMSTGGAAGSVSGSGGAMSTGGAAGSVSGSGGVASTGGAGCVAPTPDLCGASCVDTRTDPRHCGTCTRDCTTLPNLKPGAAVQCNAGGCVIPPSACAQGFANCITAPNDTDGCETATTTVRDCGTCNVPCSFPNAIASCATGTCVLSACNSDFKSCNGSCIPSSQCCVDADCPAPSANTCVHPVCSNHACTFAAQAGSCPAGGTCQVSSSMCVRGPVSAGSFNIDATEVTRGDYLAFVQAKGSDVTGQPTFCSWNTSYAPTTGWPPSVQDYDMPVTWVDWCDAFAYCAWAGRRLCGKIGGGSNLTDNFNDPTQSQWMHACVGTSNTAYPYGNTFDPTRCNGPLSNFFGPVPVGQESTCVGGYAGLFDMSGNVWEWEDSCSASTGATDECRERGSSYVSTRDDSSGIFLRCDANNNNPRQSSDSSVGFRCCGG
jgi:hypothetical protein